jgi:soluble lytic murein transglycosylase
MVNKRKAAAPPLDHLLPAGLVRPLLWCPVLIALAIAAWVSTPAIAQVSETPDASPTPRPTATPTPSPADLSLAGSFAELGKVDEARGAFLAVIERGPANERLKARYELAKLLLDEDDNKAVIDQLDAFLIEAPMDADVRNAQLLLAEALSADGQFPAALPLFEVYIRDGGDAAPYAALDRAQALAWLGDAGASSAADAALQGDFPRPIRLQVVRSIAEILQQTRPAEAIAWYERLAEESSDPSDDALAKWRIALVQRDLGDDVPWVNVWSEIVSGYPDSAVAREALSDAPAGGTVQIDPFYVGLVHYYAGDVDRARVEFLEALSKDRAGQTGELAARASFYLGVLDEREGLYSSAIQRYADVLEIEPGVAVADDALWWMGRLYELEGDDGLARDAYEELSDSYGSTDFGRKADFRVSLLSYDLEEWGDAAEAFDAIAKRSSGEDKLRALLWRGKALRNAGDREAAEEIWSSIVDTAGDGYYGLRAAVLLGDGRGDLEDADLDAAEDLDWNGMETWLIGSGSGNPTAARLAFQSNSHWHAGVALLEIGMEHRASTEFAEVLESSLGDPNMLLLLSKEFHADRQYGLSARAAARLIGNMPDSALATAPVDLWKAAYPIPYAEAFDDAAGEFDVQNMLLLALVRQESFFEPRAGSSAGAIGLTQVIQPTGEEIAEELEISGFELDDLYRPDTSLRFGAHYMASQLDALDGNIYYALAAYNGGPGNAERWADAADDDVDRFVAEIEFDQTELYVRLVTENLARYRQLYQGFDNPVLPED